MSKKTARLFKVLFYISLWLFAVYIQMVLWDVFTTWADTFKWDELTGSVFYVTWIKFMEICGGVSLLLMALAMTLVPMALHTISINKQSIK